jgi:hypothetical protein
MDSRNNSPVFSQLKSLTLSGRKQVSLSDATGTAARVSLVLNKNSSIPPQTTGNMYGRLYSSTPYE